MTQRCAVRIRRPCLAQWHVHVVRSRAPMLGFGLNMCVKHWRRLEEAMTAAGYVVVDCRRTYDDPPKYRPARQMSLPLPPEGSTGR